MDLLVDVKKQGTYGTTNWMPLAKYSGLAQEDGIRDLVSSPRRRLTSPFSTTYAPKPSRFGSKTLPFSRL